MKAKPQVLGAITGAVVAVIGAVLILGANPGTPAAVYTFAQGSFEYPRSWKPQVTNSAGTRIVKIELPGQGTEPITGIQLSVTPPISGSFTKQMQRGRAQFLKLAREYDYVMHEHQARLQGSPRPAWYERVSVKDPSGEGTVTSDSVTLLTRSRRVLTLTASSATFNEGLNVAAVVRSLHLT